MVAHDEHTPRPRRRSGTQSQLYRRQLRSLAESGRVVTGRMLACVVAEDRAVSRAFGTADYAATVDRPVRLGDCLPPEHDLLAAFRKAALPEIKGLGVQAADGHWSGHLQRPQIDGCTGDRHHQGSTRLPPVLPAWRAGSSRRIVARLSRLERQALAMCSACRVSCRDLSARGGCSERHHRRSGARTSPSKAALLLYFSPFRAGLWCAAPPARRYTA